MDFTIPVSVGSFILIVCLLVMLRSKNSRFEVKPADIIVAVVPVILFLLVTGKLQKFEIGESGIKMEAAFVKASTSAIAGQITSLKGLPSEPIQVDPKMGVGEISRLIKRKTEGLLFRIGHGGYYGPAIKEYLVRLAHEPFLKYIIIENPDGTFFGMANARELASIFESHEGQAPLYNAQDFADWLNRTNKEALSQLPGFLSSQSALSKEADKGQALQKMEELNIETLPVLDQGKRFIGIVDRSRLTASLLIDVTKNLDYK